MLDEAGIALWEEALGPGVSTKNILDPTFMASHLADMAHSAYKSPGARATPQVYADFFTTHNSPLQ